MPVPSTKAVHPQHFRGGGHHWSIVHWDPTIDDMKTCISKWIVEVVKDAYFRAD